MRRWLVVGLWCGILVLTAAALTAAQQPGGDEREDKKTKQLPVPEPGPLRDPTTPSERMKDVLGKKGGTAAAKVSPLALRGRIIAANRPPAALLEVDGRIYTVQKGTFVAGANNNILKVLDITANEVQVQNTVTKDVFTLR
jgi:hypothetical protein